jgi:hypothetical protein
MVINETSSEGSLVKRTGKDFRELEGRPKALQISQDNFNVAAVFPKKLPACAAR